MFHVTIFSFFLVITLLGARRTCISKCHWIARRSGTRLIEGLQVTILPETLQLCEVKNVVNCGFLKSLFLFQAYFVKSYLINSLIFVDYVFFVINFTLCCLFFGHYV